MICQVTGAQKGRFGVVPICRALSEIGVQIAPRTYWAHRSRQALWDTVVTEVLAGIYEPGEQGRRPPEALYGSLKMWAHLQCHGIPVARCTVERLMRASGWRGTTRAARTGPRCRGPVTRGHQTWCTVSSPRRRRTRRTSPTSPTCRSTAAGSDIPRW